MRSRLVVVALGLAVVACGGGGTDGDGGAGTADAGVTVQGTDSLAFEPSEVSASQGDTLALACGDAVNHTFVVEQGEQQIAACEPGETATGSLDLEPGELTFYCDVPGHREAGMEGTLTIE